MFLRELCETLNAVILLSLGYAFGVCWEVGGNLFLAISTFVLVLFLVVLLIRMLLRSKKVFVADLPMGI